MGLLCSAAACAFGAPVTATAAEANAPADLTEVVVTARRVEENIQDVPLSVTALSATQLKEQGVVTVRDLTTTVPSLTIAPIFNSLYNAYNIRGLSAGVVSYFSESPCCTSGAAMSFMDIGSVQVLNGPQGTLFGRTSAAGAVLITPRHPDLDQFGGRASLTVGDYGRLEAEAALNLPIIPGKLGARLAVRSDDLDGYTKQIGGGDRLDEINTQQVRLGVEFKSDRFKTYAVGYYANLDNAHTNEVLAAINPNLSVFGLGAFGAAVFTPVCTQAVAVGFSPSVGACIDQRVSLLNAQLPALQAELARVQSGKKAIRFQPGATGGQPTLLKQRTYGVVNVAELQLAKSAGLDLTLRDIASADWCSNVTASPADGVGGLVEKSGAFILCGNGKNNAQNDLAIVRLGRPTRTYNNDAQLRFGLQNDLLTGTLGFFYSHYHLPSEDEGTPNIYQIFGGVFNPALEQNALPYYAGGHGGTKALYGQTTLDVSRFGIHGLKVTGGYRYSWDRTFLKSQPAAFDYSRGVYQPGPTVNILRNRSKGYNYTASVSEEFTDDLMVYFTLSRAYVPGGLNTNIQGATNLPNYKPTYGPETVKTRELGAKWDFTVAGMPARLDGAAYWYDFSDIFVGFSGVNGTQSVAYTANAAAAKLKGFELTGLLQPIPSVDIRGSYNFNDARYTRWTASDPVNVAKPGDAICLPTSPAGFCLLDLTGQSFPYMPRHQAHLTVVYRPPMDDALGELSLAATAYYQSRVYYVSSAERHLQVLPDALYGISQGDYMTLNLRADWNHVRGGDWNVAAFVNNATDRTYKLSNTSQILTLGFSIATYAPPRMFGVEISRDF